MIRVLLQLNAEKFETIFKSFYTGIDGRTQVLIFRKVRKS